MYGNLWRLRGIVIDPIVHRDTVTFIELAKGQYLDAGLLDTIDYLLEQGEWITWRVARFGIDPVEGKYKGHVI